MGFSIELDDDTARLLHEEAARRGMDAQTLGLELVRNRVRTDREPQVARFCEMLAEVEDFGRRNPMPSLPDEALTREAIYADHA